MIIIIGICLYRCLKRTVHVCGSKSRTVSLNYMNSFVFMVPKSIVHFFLFSIK